MRTLSGGERQRLSMVALDLQESEWWLCDEPANHLDPAQQLRAYARMAESWRAGQAVVCVTHDVNLLWSVAAARAPEGGGGRVRVDGQNASFETRGDRRGKRATRLRVRRGVSCSMRAKIGWRFRPSGRDARPMPRNRSKCGWGRRIGRDDARERAVRAGGGRSAHLRRGFALGVRHRAPRPSRTAGRRRVRDAQCRVPYFWSTGVRVVSRDWDVGPGTS